MTAVKRAAHRWTIPVNLVLIAWVTIGRAFVAPDLLWVIGSLMIVAPLLLVMLGATSTLAIVQHRPAEGGLTTPQFWSLAVTWAAVAGFGLFSVTGGLTPLAESPFTSLVGAGALDASEVVADACLYAFGFAYLTLLVLLILGLRGRRERRADRILPPPTTGTTPSDRDNRSPD